MDKQQICELMLSADLFSSANREKLLQAIERGDTVVCKKGEQMLEGTPALYFIIEGRAAVRRQTGEHSVLLNTLCRGDVFGAAQLFGGGKRTTTVRALQRCLCLRLDQRNVEQLLEQDHGFAVGYITFLSDKIRFLNQKIASFTAGDGEKTLADYLISASSGSDTVVLSGSMVRLASTLNISRPTLYRAFAALSDEGLIQKDGNIVRILSKEKLRSI